MLTTTNTVLLEGLQDPKNEDVWREFDARYRPVVLAFARRLGLDDADAADAAQEAMLEFVQGYRAGKYERSRGRLRSWIFGIAKHRAADIRRSSARRREARGESAIVSVPSDDRQTEIWEEEWRRAIIQHAMTELRAATKVNPKTIRAFELVALGGRRPAEVAEELEMTVNDVYVARSRVLDKLQSIISELEETW